MDAMNNTKLKIEIMQAFIDGKEIEYLKLDGDWGVIKNPSWDWDGIDYRIKPEPKTIPFDFINDHKRFYNAIIKPKNLECTIYFPTSIDEKGITVTNHTIGTKFISFLELVIHYLIWNNLTNKWDECSKIK